MSSDCGWCVFQNGGTCDSDCDFKTLPLEKDAIIERIKSELSSIEKLKSKIDDEQSLNQVMDKLYGIAIMTKALKENLDVSQKEINEALGTKGLNSFDKMRLLAKMSKMKGERKKKK